MIRELFGTVQQIFPGMQLVTQVSVEGGARKIVSGSADTPRAFFSQSA